MRGSRSARGDDRSPPARTQAGQRRSIGLRSTLPVVEVVQHGRRLGNRAQQIAKMTKRVRADHVAVVLEEQQPDRTLARENREMILPEIDHDLEQLSLASNGTGEFRLLELGEG